MKPLHEWGSLFVRLQVLGAQNIIKIIPTHRVETTIATAIVVILPVAFNLARTSLLPQEGYTEFDTVRMQFNHYTRKVQSLSEEREKRKSKGKTNSAKQDQQWERVVLIGWPDRDDNGHASKHIRAWP